MAVVDKGWHHRLCVELGIGGVELIALRNVDVVPLPLEPLLGQSTADLRRTYRRAVMVELQHDASLASYAATQAAQSTAGAGPLNNPRSRIHACVLAYVAAVYGRNTMRSPGEKRR